MRIRSLLYRSGRVLGDYWTVEVEAFEDEIIPWILSVGRSGDQDAPGVMVILSDVNPDETLPIEYEVLPPRGTP